MEKNNPLENEQVIAGAIVHKAQSGEVLGYFEIMLDARLFAAMIRQADADAKEKPLE